MGCSGFLPRTGSFPCELWYLLNGDAPGTGIVVVVVVVVVVQKGGGIYLNTLVSL